MGLHGFRISQGGYGMNKRWLRQVGSIVVAMFLMVSNILVDITPVYAALSDDSVKEVNILLDETYSLTEGDDILAAGSDENLIINDTTNDELPEDMELVEEDIITSDGFISETSTVSENAPEVDIDDEDYEISPDGALISMSQAEYDNKVNGFLSLYGDQNTHYANCFYYACYFSDYMYGVQNYYYGGEKTIVKNAYNIQAGDIVRVGDWDGSEGGHTFVVLYRSGNNLYTAEDNVNMYDGRGYRCRVANPGYRIENENTISWIGDTGRVITTWTLFQGYHFADIQSSPTPAPKPQGKPMTQGYARAVPDGYYQIVSNLDSNYALDIQGYAASEISDGSKLQLFKNRNVNQDVFELTYNSSDRFYRIKHVLSGKYLDVKDASPYMEAEVQAFYNKPSEAAQKWAIQGAGDGKNYYIYPKVSGGSGFRLDVKGGRIDAIDATRPPLWIYESIDYSAQKWRLVPYPNGTAKTIENGNYHIVSKMDNATKGLNVAGTSGNFRNVTAVANLTNASQVFNVAFESSTNSYIIKQKDTKYYLEVENAGKTRNIGVATGDANGNPDGNWKKWNILNSPSASGWYYIASRETGESIHYNYSQYKENVQPVRGDKIYDDQLWKFVRAVDSVSISKSSASTKVGTNITLTATVSPSSAANKNVTWSSSNTNVATVNSSGVVTPKAVGTTNIIVKTVDGGYTATCKVTVDKIPVTGVSLNKSNTNIVVGKTETLTATVLPANATNKSVTWTSSNTSIATVSSTGVVTAKSAGTATITVKTADGGKTATCKVTVNPATVAVTGVSINDSQGRSFYGTKYLATGKTEVLTAVITPSNATNKSVTWSSSNTNVATISNTGLVTAKAEGTATITVRTEDGSKSATCTITVGTIPVITTNSLPGGKAGQEYVYIFEAAGTKPIEWCMLDFWCDDNNSANDIFSGLGDENGRLSLYLKHGGNIRITVEARNRYGATSKEFSIAFIEDKPDIVESTTIVAGQKINLKETCFRNVDESISRYIVDSKKVATISKTMLSGVKAGTVKVTAQSLVGKNKYEDVATCNVMVLNKPKLKFGIPMTYEGQTKYASDYFTTSDTNTLGATYWESSKPDVVEVTDSTAGLLTAHKSGSAKITAYFGEKGKKGTLKVSATINVKKPAFQKNDYKLQTGGKAVLAMKNVVKAQNPEWFTDNENVAVAEKQLDKNGQPTGKVIVKALNCGDTVLTARIDGQEYKCTIHVGAPEISKTKLTIKVNKNATVSLKNTKLPKSSIEWYSENPDIAAVSPNGKIKGIEKGQTIIYTEAGGVRNECVVTVK